MSGKPIISISVRELVEFVCRTGDLAGAGEFSGASRALEGTRGHQRLQKSRPAGYSKEVALDCSLDVDSLTLEIKGRIDGVFQTDAEVWIEEIKTTRGSWNGEADELHWAQGKIYGHIFGQQQQLPAVEIRLTYLDLETEQVTTFSKHFPAAELTDFFAQVTAEYLRWATAHHDWCLERNASIAALKFPFQKYRDGQRRLAVEVYRTLARSGKLFVEAPTGIGKTVSVLFPSIKALGEGRFTKIFYLTAKTSGRAAADQALEDLRRAGLRCRSVTLTAKDKICFNEGRRCDPQQCPFAIGYYDRNKNAIREALALARLNRSAIEHVARKHNVCPFELSLDCAVWVDVVIGDYNHAFDPAANLRRFFDEVSGDYAFLVDEAHNLVDRAREMFSAELRRETLAPIRRMISDDLPKAAKGLARILTLLNQLRKAAPNEPSIVGKQLPETLVPLLHGFLGEAEQWLAQNRPAMFRDELLELYFRVHAFARTAETFDDHYVTILDGEREELRFRLFCLDPSHLLADALKRGKAAIFFSATLSPLEYFRNLLGGDETDRILQLSSPFPSANLRVLLEDGIQTTFKARAQSFAAVADAVAAVAATNRGNYLVFFPSHQYLSEVFTRFVAQHPSVKTLAQSPKMSDAERNQFIAAFTAEPAETQIGFAVMGGVFGEGIDLVGDRLVGAMIVGVGLPQLCCERDLIRDYFEERLGRGFDYAYTFPGMNRVLQAAGRVIRSETDRGVVLLIDARFRESRYQNLFPSWWHVTPTRGTTAIRARAAEFWGPIIPDTEE